MKIPKSLLAAAAAAALNYSTSCAVVDPSSADGYVTNFSTSTYQVTGPVRFVFSTPNDMSRPAIVVNVNAMIPAGQTARIAHVKLAVQPSMGGLCAFQVHDAIRTP
jgi:hypothetical protein